jgi:hypothetical protein
MGRTGDQVITVKVVVGDLSTSLRPLRNAVLEFLAEEGLAERKSILKL